MRSILLHCLCWAGLMTALPASGQTEFPREFILHLKLGTGAIAAPILPEYFGGTLDLRPQYTLIKNRLRGGLAAGGFYTARRVEGSLGPTVSLKLSEFKGGYFGSLGNLHLNLDHLWTTDKRKLFGGGINADVLNKLVIGLSGLRDYRNNMWWCTSSFALRLSKVKKPVETFPN